MLWLIFSLCTPHDPDFWRYAYPAHIAICHRNVDYEEKRAIAKRDGVADWSTVEFDHRIPLCAGGSNAMSNVWAEPLDEALQKDDVEKQVCQELREGRITQKQAIERVTAFRP